MEGYPEKIAISGALNGHIVTSICGLLIALQARY
jgi:hypothetical protein